MFFYIFRKELTMSTVKSFLILAMIILKLRMILDMISC
jgi:hypothetical protein